MASSLLTRHHVAAVLPLILGVLLSFSPVYSIGIAIILIALPLSFPLLSSGIFRPLSMRLILSFLAFMAWVMTVATYGWIAHITIPATIYVMGYVFVYFLAWHKLSERKVESSKQSTVLTSTIAFALSITGVAVLLASFYLPQPSLASSIQIITNGYDNSAHLSLIRTTYDQGGYVYGSREDVKDQIAWGTLTAYPQGWHFANAFIWKGTGLTVFTGSDSTPEIVLYILSVLAWYILAVFLFHQILWYVLQTSGSVRKIDTLTIATFVGASLIIQLLVFWGSLTFGFVTFICALAYLFLFAAIVLYARLGDFTNRDFNHLLLAPVLAVLSIAAIAQGWLFATPIVVASAFLSFFFLAPLILKKVRTSKYPVTSTLIACIIIGTPILVQLAINFKYSIQGGNQINDDGGIFGISTMLALVIVISSLVALSSKVIANRTLRTTMAGLALPAIGFCGILLLYQLSTIGHTAYFFTKALALTLCLLWLPLSCLLFAIVQKMRENLPPLYAFGVICAGFLLIPFMLGQDISSFGKLLQQKSNVSTESAEKIARVIEDSEPKQYRTFVLTGQKYDADVIGTIFTITFGSPRGATRSQCDSDALWVIITRRNNEFPNYANLCTRNEKIQVVTSAATDPSIVSRLDKTIRIVK